jgi:type IV pilus assembly protein PilO
MAEPLDSEQKKRLFLVVALLAAVAYFGYGRLYKPQREKVDALQTRLEALKSRNQTARQLTEQNGRSDVERRLTLYRDQLVRVEGLIPSNEELPDLLDAISAEAQRTGVELALIQPAGATAETYYTRRTYQLAVLGHYHEIGAFLTEIASLPRIITPTNLNVTVKSDSVSTGDPTLEAKFAIETYVLPAAPAEGAAVKPDSAHAK